MSDFNSSLPIRTETNGDAAVKVVDGTTPSQALEVDASGRVTVKATDGSGNALTSQANGAQRALDVGIDVAGVQIDPRDVRALTSSDVVTADQGTAAAASGGWPVKPTDGTNSQGFTASGEGKVIVTSALPTGANTIGAVTQSGTWSVRTQDGAGNALTSSAAGGTRPLDVAMRDGSGNLYSGTNPLPVTFSTDPVGTEVNNYSTASAIASGATSNHDYTVTALKTMLLQQIEASGSGKMKIEVQTETAAASGVFNTKFVQFNSTSSPNMSIHLESPISVVAGARVRVIRTNKDNQSQDVYSTISGQEV